MQKLNAVALDPNTGKARATATVTIFLTGLATLATLFADDETTPLANPLIADATGRFTFKAANGKYDIQISGTGFITYTYKEVQLMDSANYLPAPTSLQVGDYLKAGVGAIVLQSPPLPSSDLGSGASGLGTKFLADDQTFKLPQVLSGLPGFTNLVGDNDGASPDTKYVLSAALVQLRNTTTGELVTVAGSSLTNDITVAGPVVNGRDQAGAFSAGSWVYFHTIWNGATLASLSSASATAPVLPTGYLFSTFAGAVRLDGASKLVKTHMRDNYASIAPVIVRALGAGTGSEQSYDISANVPPNHSGVALTLYTNIGNVQNEVRVAASGTAALDTNVAASPNIQLTLAGRVPLVAQTVYYIGNAGGIAVIQLLGYWMRN